MTKMEQAEKKAAFAEKMANEAEVRGYHTVAQQYRQVAFNHRAKARGEKVARVETECWE